MEKGQYANIYPAVELRSLEAPQAGQGRGQAAIQNVQFRQGGPSRRGLVHSAKRFFSGEGWNEVEEALVLGLARGNGQGYV